MSPAPRLAVNRGLERNLYTHPTGGYRWRNPRTQKFHYLGQVSREEANTAARILNLKFSRYPSLVDKVLGHAATSLRAVIELHQSQVLAKARLSQVTRKNREYRLGRLAKDLGELDAGDISTADLALYMRGLSSDSMRQHYRQSLIDLFRTAVEEGYRTDNPAAALRQVTALRQRGRLDLAGFRSIYRVSPDWFRRCLRLAITSCLRRDDLAALKFDQVTDGVLRIRLKKTGVHLAMRAHPALLKALAKCRDPVVSPYVVHRLPERIPSRERRASARGHFTAVLPKELSKAFAAARERSGRYKGIANPPTFHEVRSLGMHLLESAGVPRELMQAFVGHRKAAMTEHYLEGHERPFQEVSVEAPAPRRFVTDVSLK